MSEPLGDPTLIEQARAGNRTALAELLLEHYDGLRRHLEFQLNQGPATVLSADDVLQQTFVRVALGIHSFESRSAGGFRAWLYTIATNLVRDAHKRRRRERRAPLDPSPGRSLPDRAPGGVPPADASVPDWSVAAPVDHLAGTSTSPSMRVHRRDSVESLRLAMRQLPDEQREVIERHYLKHQSFEEIAIALQRTKDAVRGISNRARRNLRLLLGHSSGFFSH